jgi:hypothetical protein
MFNPWSAIETPSADFNVRLVRDDHPLKLFWGLDSKGRYLFAYDAASEGLPRKKNLPSLSGIDLNVVAQGSRGKLVLIVHDNANWELFHAVCSDLVRATASVKDEATASVILVRRLQRWQELMKKARKDLLTPEEIKGLLAELCLLTTALSASFGHDAAIGSWRGPECAPQDFSIGETAIEVKCQSGASKPMVRISSADQLSPQLPVGYLVVFTFAGRSGSEPEFLTLNTLVARIRHELSAASAATRERFEDLLFMAGFVIREEYDEYCFSIVSVKSFKLGVGFPRIERSVLIEGVESVAYNIRLDACAKFKSIPAWWPSEYGN